MCFPSERRAIIRKKVSTLYCIDAQGEVKLKRKGEMKYILVICDMRVFVLKPLLFGAMRLSVILGGIS